MTLLYGLDDLRRRRGNPVSAVRLEEVSAGFPGRRLGPWQLDDEFL